MRRAVSLVGVVAASLAFVRPASAEPATDAPVPVSPRIVPPPDGGYAFQGPRYRPTLAWWLTQLIPSPEVAAGNVRRIGVDGPPEEKLLLAFGLRWQVTPVLWSWGTNRNVSRWRYFVVDPLARHAGSLELNGTIEYVMGHVDRFLVRPGVRATFPLIERGEYLSGSIGTSTYAYDDTMRVAYDVGLYALFGVLGVQMTFAPSHAPLQAIGTFRIRYF